MTHYIKMFAAKADNLDLIFRTLHGGRKALTPTTSTRVLWHEHTGHEHICIVYKQVLKNLSNIKRALIKSYINLFIQKIFI